jgi:hypothetical protein
MPETSKSGLKRETPDVITLLRVLSEAEVEHVVTGSAAAMLHGVLLVPGDLDITPALDFDNLTRLAQCSSRSRHARIHRLPSDTGSSETMVSSTGWRPLRRRKPSPRVRAGGRTLHAKTQR